MNNINKNQWKNKSGLRLELSCKSQIKEYFCNDHIPTSIVSGSTGGGGGAAKIMRC